MGNYNRKVNEMFDRNIELNNGVKIPQLGLGTWFIDDDKVADAVKAAVEIGYRYVEGNRAAWKALEDVTDELKEQNKMAWIQAMNNIYNRAEEIVIHELVL